MSAAACPVARRPRTRPHTPCGDAVATETEPTSVAPATALPPRASLPDLAKAALLIASPLELLLRCQRTYGDVFTIRTTGFGTLVVVSGHEEVRHGARCEPARGREPEDDARRGVTLVPARGARAIQR